MRLILFILSLIIWVGVSYNESSKSAEMGINSYLSRLSQMERILQRQTLNQDSLASEGLWHFMKGNWLIPLIGLVVLYARRKSDKVTKKENKKHWSLRAKFYIFGFSGIVISTILNGMFGHPENLPTGAAVILSLSLISILCGFILSIKAAYVWIDRNFLSPKVTIIKKNIENKTDKAA